MVENLESDPESKSLATVVAKEMNALKIADPEGHAEAQTLLSPMLGQQRADVSRTLKAVVHFVLLVGPLRVANCPWIIASKPPAAPSLSASHSAGISPIYC
ncbi:hypothetical protein C2L64_45345 [Paraburkholderia hospita]|uniref:Uncharacterized protein n=1 Tax=Paraburkholderia hospita TaxID=169430 RepID=A0AAN1MQF7_9BURK|nr:hypothetical protein [Paraburkholderia hospita]AUT75594.1 hypothetical protein C2L64_45345 [Paraburkholderia hospita]